MAKAIITVSDIPNNQISIKVRFIPRPTKESDVTAAHMATMIAVESMKDKADRIISKGE